MEKPGSGKKAHKWKSNPRLHYNWSKVKITHSAPTFDSLSQPESSVQVMSASEINNRDTEEMNTLVAQAGVNH